MYNKNAENSAFLIILLQIINNSKYFPLSSEGNYVVLQLEKQ